MSRAGTIARWLKISTITLPTLGQISKASLSYYNTIRAFSHDSRMYLITSALFGFAIFGGIYTTLLNLYLLRLGYGPQEAGLINGWGQLAFGIVALPVGIIGRYWGSRRMLIAGLSMITLGVGLLPLVEFSPVGLMAWLVTAQIMVQVGIAIYFVNGGPFIATVSAPAERNHVFAMTAAIWPLTGFLGSLVGGFLPGLFASWLGDSPAAPAPYRYALLIAAVLMFLAVLAALNTRTHDTPAPGSRTKKDKLPVGIFAIMFLTVLLRVIGEGVVRTFFNIYLDAGLQLPVAQIGALMSAGQLLAVPAALLMPLLAARSGINSTYIYSTLGMGLSLLPMAFVPGWGTAAIGYMGVIALLSISRPSIVAIQMESVSPGWRTMLAGTTSAAVGLGWAIASFAGGFLITSFGYSSIFLGGAAVTVAGALVYWLYLRRAT